MSHHAYLYEGPLSLLSKLADSACVQFGFEKSPSTMLGAGNPDVRVLEWEKFGIDEARELTREASLKSVSGRALFVLGTSSITSESQQALLKLFEEPAHGVVFVLLVPHGTLLSTLRSRFLPYPAEISAQEETDAKEFLAAPYKTRSEWITKFLKDDEGARERTRSFLNDVESLMYKRMQKEPSRELREGLEDIGHFRNYVADRAPSLKMILEHFAVTLPTLK